MNFDHYEIEVSMYDEAGKYLGITFGLDGEMHPIKPGYTLKVRQARKVDKERGLLE